MEELLSIATEIRDLLANLNQKLDTLTHNDVFGIIDIVAEIRSLKESSGYGLSELYNNQSELNGKIDSITGYGVYNISDIITALQRIR